MNILAIDIAEEWRSIPGWPEYEASSHGRIRRVKSSRGTRAGKLLKQTIDTGYFKVSLSRDAQPKRDWVHRLVAMAFHGVPSDPLMEVAHKDNDGQNNIPSNLRWATRADNSADRVGHGTHIRGEANPGAKLLEDQVIKIRAALVAGIKRRTLAEMFDVSLTAIDDIAVRRTWRHIQ